MAIVCVSDYRAVVDKMMVYCHAFGDEKSVLLGNLIRSMYLFANRFLLLFRRMFVLFMAVLWSHICHVLAILNLWIVLAHEQSIFWLVNILSSLIMCLFYSLCIMAVPFIFY